MPEPVFTEADRVAAANATLPTELQGKSAAEVAKFYQDRETKLQADLRAAQTQPAPVATVKTKTPDNADFWTDPAGSVQTAIKAGSVTREEFANASAFVQRQMTEMAEFLTAQKHTDWKLFKADIDDIMSKVEPGARADSNMWETAYIYAVGRNPERAVQARSQTVVIPTQGVERGAAATTTVTTPTPELTVEQEFVRSHMGITKEAYLDANKHIQAGTFPLTYDNREVGRR
jgi:hypothetical protein